MKERLMVFGTAFMFSCLAVMFYLHFRKVRSGEASLIKRWVNAAGEIGSVVEWVEADTLIVELPNETGKVRLNAVDTPALWQSGGEEAMAHVVNLVAGNPVRVLEFRRDEEGIIIGEVYNSDNLSLNEELMKAGWGWFYEPDSPNNPYYRELNDQAIQEKYGLWSSEIPTPPWKAPAPGATP